LHLISIPRIAFGEKRDLVGKNLQAELAKAGEHIDSDGVFSTCLNARAGFHGRVAVFRLIPIEFSSTGVQ
jgi:hypothetical protein